MEWPKLKNIIILILLLVNGFLLVLVVGREFQVSRYERSAFTQAGQVLAQNGITVDEDLLEQAVRESLVPLTVQRDLQAEMDIAQALLGCQAVRTDQGGGLYGYDSDRGSALFRSNGDFSFSLLDCPLDGQSPSNHAADILKQMGLNGEELGSQTAGEQTKVSFRQVLNDVPVYTCRLDFLYGNGRLLSISGTLMTGSVTPVSTPSSALDLPTALISFLRGVLERGDVCSSIDGLRLGYRSSQAFGADIRLTPTWLITTNISGYYLDAATGTLTPAEI